MANGFTKLSYDGKDFLTVHSIHAAGCGDVAKERTRASKANCAAPYEQQFDTLKEAKASCPPAEDGARIKVHACCRG